ncbi:putative sporulation protein YyaC [Pelagirhabdus alkalitolerans]|uniref:Putative sporulation protein YyaC n=1 Tax=Pelagirhabdus alkalitolerans TaxID=1612202 RepID=A0A1G6LCA3_9BACI|nr:spore protease YyaC [Pelagirhabdus alkalitolerans]SDC40834.1 putative sporulation protein YyaC [Pelagirhabdus alkalitolerans]
MKISDSFKEPLVTRITRHYQTRLIYQELGDFINSWIPSSTKEVVVICIGTDRSTGDAMGPITGSLLKKWRHLQLKVYGTLKEPIHAVNLKEQLLVIQNRHPNAFFIAIDACLGKPSSIGHITASIGALKPGLALKKDLPEVGNLHITGIVNASTPVDYVVLQNTRLHLVMEQAETIARTLLYLDRHYLRAKNESG